MDFISYLVFACACAVSVFCLKENQNNQEQLEVSLVLDFLDFYDFHHAWIIDSGEGDGQKRLSWPYKILKEGKTAFGSVVPLQRYLNHSNGANESQTLSQYKEITDLLFLHMQRLQQENSHIFIHRFYKEEDLSTFRELFEGYEAISDWLLLSDDTFRDLLHQVYLPINNKVNIAVVNTEEGSAALWQAYQVVPHLDMKEVRIGKWIYKKQEDIFKSKDLVAKQIFSVPETKDENPLTSRLRFKELEYGSITSIDGDYLSQRTDLTGLHLRCTTIGETPFSVVMQGEDGSLDVSGIAGIIFNHLQEVTNFTSSCHIVEDRAYGSLVDGRWNGLIGEVYDGIADIAVAAIDIAQIRSRAVDYLLGMGYLKYIMYMKRPLNSDYMWTAYTKQFQPLVWWIIVVFLILMTTLLYCHLRMTNTHYPGPFQDSAFTILCLTVGQSTSISLVHLVPRLIALTTLVAHVLLLAHYTSDLVSGLTAGPPPPRASNLLDIAASSDLQLGYVKHVAVDEYMRDSSIDAYRDMWKDIHKNNLADLASSNDDGFNRALDDKNYVFMLPELAFFFSYGQDCRVYLLPSGNFPTQFSFVVKKDSPLTPIFNKVLMKMHSSGLIDKWIRDWTPEVVDCNLLETSAIELPTILVPLLLLGIALFISLGILVFERYVFNPHKKVVVIYL